MISDIHSAQGQSVTGQDAATPQNALSATAQSNNGDVVFYYLSELLGCPVRREDESRPFGRLYDIGATTSSAYPQAVCLEIKNRRDGKRLLPWSDVRTLSPREIVVRRESEAARPPADFWIRRDVLDDQVVDVSGIQVLRVNDVHLLYSGKRLILGHVEVGIRGILRRLRFERPVSFLLRWLFDYSLKDSFVTWRHIEVLSPGGVPGGLRVSRLPERLADVHPGELAEILEHLGLKGRQAVFTALPVETAAEALEAVTPENQRTLVAQGQPERVADILDEMPSQEAAGVLREVGPDAHAIINRMEQDSASDVRAVLAHKERSAGGIMATGCIEARPDESAAAVLARIRQTASEVDVYNVIYVLDGERRLLGVASLKFLLGAPENSPLAQFMMEDSVTVKPDATLQDVARLFLKYGFMSIPVVDATGIFLGAVRAESVLPELAPMVKD